MSDDIAAQQFIALLSAAMLDAAVEGKLTQMQTTVTPPGKGTMLVRLVVIPEAMDFVRGGPTGKFERPA